MAAFASASPSPSISASPWRMDSLRAALPGGQAPVVVLALGASAAATAASVGCLGSFSCLAPVSPLLSLGAENSSFEHRLFGIDARGRILAVRHGKRVPKLNRPPEAWKNGRIKTTKTRAKAMRKYVEKMITLAKDGSLHKRRQALAFIYEKHTVHALFAEVADRNGGERGGLHKDHPNISKAGR